MSNPYGAETGAQGKDWQDALVQVTPLLVLVRPLLSGPLGAAHTEVADGLQTHLFSVASQPRPSPQVCAATNPAKGCPVVGSPQ